MDEWLWPIIKLFVASLLSALLGWDRQQKRKAAGLRTHILVGLGACLVIVAAQMSGVPTGDISRVIQGLITGIGFIGAGAIFKADREEHTQGLTTAASIWVTAGIGAAIGLGAFAVAAAAAVFAILTLSVLSLLEAKISPSSE